MALSEEMKQVLLGSAERSTELALNEVLVIAEGFAKESDNAVDDAVVGAVRMLKTTFLDALVDKIADDGK